MGTGGIRYGAGQPGWHVKAEHCRSIDARRWAREGILRDGRAGCWAWRDAETGERLASIGYRTEAHSVALEYTLNRDPMLQRLQILRTPCNYGGERSWFGCSRCGGRVAVLYLRNLGFACRKCNRIAYGSQSDDAIGLTWRKQAKIERRLDKDWERPRGMHRATYDRLLDRLEECQQARDAGLYAVLSKLAPDFH